MEKFNYREYLNEGWLFQEAGRVSEKSKIQSAINLMNQQFQAAGLTTYASVGRVYGCNDPAATVFSCEEEQNDPTITQAMDQAREQTGAYVQCYIMGSRENLQQWRAARENQ